MLKIFIITLNIFLYFRSILFRKNNLPGKIAVIIPGVSLRKNIILKLNFLLRLRNISNENIYLISLSGGDNRLKSGIESATNFFHLPDDVLFNTIYLDKNIKLFNTNYGNNFILKLVSHMSADARLFLPNWKPSKCNFGLSQKSICQLLGVEGKKVIGDTYIEYKNIDFNNFQFEKASVLKWYICNQTELVDWEIGFKSGKHDIENLINNHSTKEFLLHFEKTSNRYNDNRKTNLTRTENKPPPDLLSTIKSHAYLISGVSYKSAIVLYIIKKTMPDKRDINYLDVGGSFGALAAELLLSETDLIKVALTRDISFRNIYFANHLYNWYYKELKGRFKFSVGPVESFAFTDSYDVISFIGSLLYVDKNSLKMTIKKAWESLSYGGILIIHENIKAASYTNDYDVMFTPEAIDTLLLQFSDIRYFSSIDYSELLHKEVKNNTVFRVIQKNSGKK